MSAPQAVPAPGVYGPDQTDTVDGQLEYELWTAMNNYERRFGFDAIRQRSAENLMEIADGHRRNRKAA